MPQGPQVVVLPAFQHIHLPRWPAHRSFVASTFHHLLPKRSFARVQSERFKATESAQTTEATERRIRGNICHRR